MSFSQITFHYKRNAEYAFKHLQASRYLDFYHKVINEFTNRWHNYIDVQGPDSD